MKTLSYIGGITLAFFLAGCQTMPVEPEPAQEVVEPAPVVKTYSEQWKESEARLVQELRKDARLRVQESDGQSVFVQIRSGGSFTLSGAKPTVELTSVLDHIAATIDGHEYIDIYIYGHTDSLGNEKNNLKLSEQRAKAVADYLVMVKNVKQPVHHEGRGSAEPIASNDSAEGRAVNRRIDILLKPLPNADQNLDKEELVQPQEPDQQAEPAPEQGIADKAQKQ